MLGLKTRYAAALLILFTIGAALIVEPDARKLSEAIARGKRVFASRRAEAQIDGFRVIERITGEPYFWYYDDPDHVFAEDGERLPL
jgi:hypothetical protein